MRVRNLAIAVCRDDDFQGWIGTLVLIMRGMRVIFLKNSISEIISEKNKCADDFFAGEYFWPGYENPAALFLHAIDGMSRAAADNSAGLVVTPVRYWRGGD